MTEQCNEESSAGCKGEEYTHLQVAKLVSQDRTFIKPDQPVFRSGIAESAVSLGEIEESVEIALKTVESTFCVYVQM